MADSREPPPLFDEPLGENKTDKIEDDDDDLFHSIAETPETKPSTTDKVGSNDSMDPVDKGDIFKDADEVPLDSAADNNAGQSLVNGGDPSTEKVKVAADAEPYAEASGNTADGMNNGSDKATTSSTVPDIKPDIVSASGEGGNQNADAKENAPTSSTATGSSATEAKDELKLDPSHYIEVTVTDPQKIGDGMGAYMAYRVQTKTNIPLFSKKEFGVSRRFSDFLGIHGKLHEKHFHVGRIVPPAPEKSVMGMTKVKMSKDDPVVDEFVGRRRAALERYLNRTAQHPALLADADFREFLERDEELPKATNTAALSGAGVMRLFSKMGESVNKMTYKMDESDQWFEEKQVQIDNLDQQLRKVHIAVEALVHNRRELSQNAGLFAKSAAMLGNCEEHTSLSRALSQLAEVEEKVEHLHNSQADTDLYYFAELLKDYINLITAIKEVFHQRVKVFHNWQNDKAMLSKKRENEARLQLQGKTDKITQAKAEVKEYEEKVVKSEQEFDAISRTIRKEIQQFDETRVKDFKKTLIKYLENHMDEQQKLIQYWGTFLPEAEAITTK